MALGGAFKTTFGGRKTSNPINKKALEKQLDDQISNKSTLRIQRLNR